VGSFVVRECGNLQILGKLGVFGVFFGDLVSVC